jgi:hypothetical protein
MTAMVHRDGALPVSTARHRRSARR